MENEHRNTLDAMIKELDRKDEPEVIPAPETDASQEEIIELGEDFNFDGFQVVRREFFAHMNEPSVSFSGCKVYVNCTCLSKFPDTEYVQALVNPETKILALRPCDESARDSFLWCSSNAKGKPKPKQVTCKLFFAKIAALMGWNPNHRYKMLGKLIHANNEYLIAFDLNSTEVYQRSFPEGQKPKTSRTPVFPSGWQNQFGMPFNEHEQSLQVNIVDGYAIFAIKDKGPAGEEDGSSATDQNNGGGNRNE